MNISKLPNSIDRPTFLVPLDCGGAVRVVLFGGASAYVSTPGGTEANDLATVGVDVGDCAPYVANRVDYRFVSGHFKSNGEAWKCDDDTSSFTLSRGWCSGGIGGDATDAGRAIVVGSIRRGLDALVEAFPGALREASVADVRSRRARTLGEANTAANDLRRALHQLDTDDFELAQLGAGDGGDGPRAGVRLDDEGRPWVELDGASVGLRIGRLGGLRLGVDWGGDRESLDGLDVSRDGGPAYAVESTDDPKAFLFGEAEVGRDVARILLGHCSALLAERMGLGDRPADGTAAWGAVVDACAALGFKPDPAVEADFDGVGDVVRAARGVVVALDDIDLGEAWANLASECDRLRTEVEGVRRRGFRGPRTGALLRAADDVLAWVDSPTTWNRAPVLADALAQAVAPFGEVVES